METEKVQYTLPDGNVVEVGTSTYKLSALLFKVIFHNAYNKY